MKKSMTRRPTSSLTQTPFEGWLPRNMMSELFDQFLADGGNQMTEIMSAAMDVAETEQTYEVKMDLPGVNTDDVDIQIDNNTLTVRGQRSNEVEEQDEAKQYHRVERYSGSFSRSVVLPASINENETAAEFRDGVLKIVIPKSEDAKPRKISING